MEIASLAIGGRKVTDAGLKHLKYVRGLWSLNLLRNSIKGSGLQYLKDQPNGGKADYPVEVLYLSDVTDETLKNVCGLPELRRLYLVRPKSTDAGYAYLRKTSALQLLSVSSGSKRSESRKYAEHVQTILPNCIVSDAYPEQKPETGRADDALTAIRSEYGTMPPEDQSGGNAPAFLAPLRKLTEYSLDHPRHTDADLKQLEDHPDVEILRLGRATISDAGMAYLKGMTQLAVLDLSNTPITDAGIDYLKGMKRLKELSLNDTQITDAAMRRLQLQSHPELVSLGVARTHVTDAGLVYVGRMITLLGLGLNDRTTDAGLKNILPLRRLAGLAIGFDNHITDVGMGYIGQFPNLEGLTVGSDQITDAGFAHLKTSNNSPA